MLAKSRSILDIRVNLLFSWLYTVLSYYFGISCFCLAKGVSRINVKSILPHRYSISLFFADLQAQLSCRDDHVAHLSASVVSNTTECTDLCSELLYGRFISIALNVLFSFTGI